MSNNEEILRLAIDSRPAEDGARRYVRSIDEVRGATRGVAGDSDAADRKFRALASGGMGVAALAASRLSTGLTGLAGLARSAGSQIVSLTNVGLRGISRGLSMAADGMRDANGELTRLGRATDAVAVGFDKAASMVQTFARIVLGLKLATAAAAVTVGVLAHKAAAEFAPAWNRVLTLVSGTPEQLGHLRAEVSNLAGDLGVGGVEAANAFYQVLSAMPQLAARPTEAVAVLDAALQASASGFAEASDAASAITGVLNAFGLEASRAEEVSTALFTAQAQGVTTFGEIAGSIDRVSGLAASLGVDFRDLLAIVSTSTSKLNTDTATTMTQIRAVMGNILRPSADAAGAARDLSVEFNAAAVEAKGLNRFLLDLIDTTRGDPETLARFFGSQEALALVVGLAQHTERLTDDMKKYANATGEAKRVTDQMSQSWEWQKGKLGGQFKSMLRDIGAEWESAGAKGLSTLNDWIEKYRELAREIRMIDSLESVPFVVGGRGFGGTPDGSNYTGDTRPAGIGAARHEDMYGVGSRIGRGDPITFSDPEMSALIAKEKSDAARELQRIQDGWDAITEQIRTDAIAFGHLWTDFTQEINRETEAALVAEMTAAPKRGRNRFGRPDHVSTLLIDEEQVGRDRAYIARTDALIAEAEAAEDAERAVAGLTVDLLHLMNSAGALSDALTRVGGGVIAVIGSMEKLSEMQRLFADNNEKGVDVLGNDPSGAAQFAAVLPMVMGMMGVVASLPSLIESFTGESEADRRARQVMENNTKALDRLARTLDGFGTRGDLVRGIETIDEIQRRQYGGDVAGAGELFKSERDRLQALADEYGITLTGGMDSLQALEDALRMATDRLFEFGDSLDQQRMQQDAWLQLNDLDADKGAVLGSQFGLLNQFAPELMKQYGLSNLSLDSETGRKVLNDTINQIFEDYTAGTLDKDLLNQFASGQEFIDALLGTDRALDAFAEGLNKAADARGDVPAAVPVLRASPLPAGFFSSGKDTPCACA